MVAIDAPNIYVLNERTNPTEVSDVSAVLDRAAYHPNDAIYNPESLTHYALGTPPTTLSLSLHQTFSHI